jgi:hypothetical protein
MPHVFQAFAGLLPEADQAVARTGSWLCEHVQATGESVPGTGRQADPRNQ